MRRFFTRSIVAFIFLHSDKLATSSSCGAAPSGGASARPSRPSAAADGRRFYLDHGGFSGKDTGFSSGSAPFLGPVSFPDEKNTLFFYQKPGLLPKSPAELGLKSDRTATASQGNHRLRWLDPRAPQSEQAS